MFQIKLATITLLSLILLLITSAGRCGQLSEEDSKFFALPHRQQEKTILLYPISKQLQLYMYGMTKLRPIAYHLLEPVASKGKDIVSPTITLLENVDSEEELSAVLALLLQIDQDVYRWRVDTDLIDMARQKAKLLKRPAWQQRVLGILQ